MSQLHVNRTELGIAEDTRNALQRLRRKEIWSKFQAAKIPFDPQWPKDALIRAAVKHNLNLERAPVSTEPIVTEDLSIHDLRKQVSGLSRADGTKWEWAQIVKLSKEQLRGILNGDDPTAGG